MTRLMSGSADRSAAWAWGAVKLLALMCVGAVAAQLAQISPSTAAPEAPPASPASAPAPVASAIAAAQAAPAPVVPGADFVVRRRLVLERGLRHGDYAWDEDGVPPGELRILIDLSAQTLSVFRGGYEIGRAVILYGTDDNPTPTGAFRITEKDIDHESNLYEAAMPYMLRLTDDGIAIHGSEVVYGRASRGCIGVPDDFASLLFARARLGDRVTIVAGTPAA